MVKDFFISFKENFNEKVSNPFLGTYFVILLFRNWEVLYAIFNFDAIYKLEDKIKFIKAYYNENSFLENFFTNIYWAFGLLVITYILLNASRFIVNIFEKRLSPWIYKITDSKSIVLKEVYEGIREERDDLQARLDKERETRSRLEAMIKGLEEELTFKSGPQNTKEFEDDIDSGVDEIGILLRKIKVAGLIKDFIKTASLINSGELINGDHEAKDYYLELGLIRFNGNSTSSSKGYNITNIGEKVLRRARLE